MRRTVPLPPWLFSCENSELCRSAERSEGARVAETPDREQRKIWFNNRPVRLRWLFPEPCDDRHNQDADERSIGHRVGVVHQEARGCSLAVLPVSDLGDESHGGFGRFVESLARRRVSRGGDRRAWVENQNIKAAFKRFNGTLKELEGTLNSKPFFFDPLYPWKVSTAKSISWKQK
ncbi:hypothetical protein U1Q18_037208 [Sarracenia purpurea var. burkii]